MCVDCIAMIDFIKKFYLKVQEEMESDMPIDTQINEVYLLLKELGSVATHRNLYFSPYVKLVQSIISKNYLKSTMDISYDELGRMVKSSRDVAELLAPLERSELIEIIIEQNPIVRKIIIKPKFQKFIAKFHLQADSSSAEQIGEQETQQTTRTLLGYIVLQMFIDYIEDSGIQGSSSRMRTAWVRYQFIFLMAQYENRTFNDSEIEDFFKSRSFDIRARESFQDILRNIDPLVPHRMIKKAYVRKIPGKLGGEIVYEFSEEFRNGIKLVRDYIRPRERDME